MATNVVKVPERVYKEIQQLRLDQANQDITTEEALDKFRDLLLPYMNHPPNPSDHTIIEIDRPPAVQVPTIVH